MPRSMPRSPLPLAIAATLIAVPACDQIDAYWADEQAEEEAVALYQTVPVRRRDIVVAVDAAGIIEPVTTVEVKSKASGEILALPVDTGDEVGADTLLARVDRRVLNNSLQLAKANLEVAKARLANAESSLERVTRLFERGSLSKADFEQATLEHATASSEVVRSEIQVENASIQLDDSDVISPIAGTVIERLVEQGQVISSPMGDVGGGTLLMKMADLSHVQVRMLVDEIDIGKVQPGVAATVNVAAYPSRPFTGMVIKVEPQAVALQNVTMFPVLIDIENRAGLLRPGMNAEVEVLIAERRDVPVIPNAALRTAGDVYAAGSVLGYGRDDIERLLAQAPALAGGAGNRASASPAAADPAPSATPAVPDRERMRAIIAKMRNGESLTDEERQLARQMRERRAARGGRLGGAGAGRSRLDTQFGGEYIVFALRDGQPVPLRVRTGVTDLDDTELVAGLTEDDEVLVLPSASLVRAQESFQRRISGRMGIPGLSRNSGRGRRD